MLPRTCVKSRLNPHLSWPWQLCLIVLLVLGVAVRAEMTLRSDNASVSAPTADPFAHVPTFAYKLENCRVLLLRMPRHGVSWLDGCKFSRSWASVAPARSDNVNCTVALVHYEGSRRHCLSHTQVCVYFNAFY